MARWSPKGSSPCDFLWPDQACVPTNVVVQAGAFFISLQDWSSWKSPWRSIGHKGPNEEHWPLPFAFPSRGFVEKYPQSFIKNRVVVITLLIVLAGASTNCLRHCEAVSSLNSQELLTRPLRCPFVPTKSSQRAGIWFLGAEGIPGAEIHHKLSAQYGNSALPQRSVYDWITMFKNGRTSVTDERYGRPSTSTT